MYNGSMKTKLIILIAIVLLAVIPGSLSNIDFVYGWYWYTPFVDAIYAVNEYVCLHEIAHKADAKNGWISRTDEWIKAAEPYKDIYAYEASGYKASQIFTEVYANLYSDVMGHAEAMPQELIRFYDFGMLYHLRIEHCSGY